MRKNGLIFVGSLFILASSASHGETSGFHKLETIWEAITRSVYPLNEDNELDLPAFTGPGIGGGVNIMCPFYLSETLKRQDDPDALPAGRKKVIHNRGVVVRIKWEAKKSHPFTGLFSSGADGLARFSYATKPAQDSSIQGMAIKLFAEGQASRNIMAMHSLDPQADSRFFQLDYSNKVPAPSSWLAWPLVWAFDLSIKWAGLSGQSRHLPVDHFASHQSDGSPAENSKWPSLLEFKATDQSKTFMPLQHNKKDFRQQLSESESQGTILYEVYGDGVHIASLQATSQFVASKFGDEALFFEHYYPEK